MAPQGPREAGLNVVDVSDVTGFPECLDGRVKTLHPKVLAGVLARDTDEDANTLKSLVIQYIDLVAVNLYPFAATIAKPSVTEAEAIENIDIGGPTMIRAAAKNSDRVTVVVDPADYPVILQELREKGCTSAETKRRLMIKVFAMTGAYDLSVAGHFGAKDGLPLAFAIGDEGSRLALWKTRIKERRFICRLAVVVDPWGNAAPG